MTANASARIFVSNNPPYIFRYFYRHNCVHSAGRWGMPSVKKALLFLRRPLNFLKFSGLQGSHCGKPLSKVFVPRLEQFPLFYRS
jgi:hypothetical protein